MLLCVLDTLTLIQLTANSLGKAAEDGSNTYSPATHMLSPDEAPGFCLGHSWLFGPSGKRVCEWKIFLSISAYNSDFQINTKKKEKDVITEAIWSHVGWCNLR